MKIDIGRLKALLVLVLLCACYRGRMCENVAESVGVASNSTLKLVYVCSAFCITSRAFEIGDMEMEVLANISRSI